MEFLFVLATIYGGMGLLATIVSSILIGALVLSVLFEKIEVISSLTLAILVAAWFYEPTNGLLLQAVANWDTVLVYFAAWFAIGGVWSVFKLWRYSSHLRSIFEAYQAEKLKGLDPSKLDREEKHSLAREIESYMRCHTKYGEGYPTQLSRIKGTITGWILYWPLNAIFYVVDEPIKRALVYVYERLGKVYTRIIDSHTASYRKQMESLN